MSHNRSLYQMSSQAFDIVALLAMIDPTFCSPLLGLKQFYGILSFLCLSLLAAFTQFSESNLAVDHLASHIYF